MNTLLAMLLALNIAPPTCGEWPADRSTKEVRQETKARVQHIAGELGLSKDAKAVLRYMVARESSGDPCAVHTHGEGEYGLGPLGLSVRWTLSKWDSHADAEVLHIPEVAAVVAIRILRRAVRLHGAKTWTEANSVFATGKIRVRPGKDAIYCKRLKSHGVDCNSNPAGQLGTKMGLGRTPNQVEVLEAMTNE